VTLMLHGTTARNTYWLGVVALLTSAAWSQVGNTQQSGWISVAPMLEARMGHAMVELPPGPNALGLSTGRGKVMVIGGFDNSLFAAGNPLASCEIYDPVTNTWTRTAPHPIAAGWRWAAVLSNGMVLVAGGAKNLTSLVAASHLYDPATNKWITTKLLPIGLTNPHAFMRTIVLPNGQVLIAGGIDENGVQDWLNGAPGPSFSPYSYIFTLNSRQPALSFWDYTRQKSDRSISRMPESRTTSALILTSTGKVLNFGGLGPSPTGEDAATNTASIFDFGSGRWTSAPPMPPVYGLGEDEFVASYPTGPGSRWAPFSQNLEDGKVLVAGGVAGLLFNPFLPRSSAVIYDPTSNTWRVTTPMLFQRWTGNWSARISDGASILFAGPGNYSDGAFTLHDLTGEIFDSGNEQWILAPVSGGPPADGSLDSFESRSVQLRDGRLQIAGGTDWNTDTVASNRSWIYTP
jgi:Kelch motif protein